MTDEKEEKKEVEVNEATMKLIKEAPSFMIGLNKQAEVIASYYKSLMENDFTDVQALQIILTRGLSP